MIEAYKPKNHFTLQCYGYYSSFLQLNFYSIFFILNVSTIHLVDVFLFRSKMKICARLEQTAILQNQHRINRFNQDLIINELWKVSGQSLLLRWI